MGFGIFRTGLKLGFALGMVCSWAISARAISQEYYKAQTDRSQVNLGDEVVYTVEVLVAGEESASPEITLPELESLFQVRDVFTRSSIHMLNGRTYVIYFKEAQLVANHTGSLTIPPSRVEWNDPRTQKRQSRESNSVSLKVLQAKGEAVVPTPTLVVDVLRPIKLKARITWIQWVPWAVAVAALGALLGLISFLRSKEKAILDVLEPKPEISPRELALEAWGSAGRWLQQGKWPELYLEVSFLTREYLGKVFRIQAVEATSRELLESLRRKQVPEDFFQKLKLVLEESDFIKFAKVLPKAGQPEIFYRMAHEIILYSLPGSGTAENIPAAEEKSALSGPQGPLNP